MKPEEGQEYCLIKPDLEDHVQGLSKYRHITVSLRKLLTFMSLIMPCL